MAGTEKFRAEYEQCVVLSVSELLRSVEGYVKVSRTTQTEVGPEKLFSGSYMGIRKSNEPSETLSLRRSLEELKCRHIRPANVASGVNLTFNDVLLTEQEVSS